MTYKLSSTRFLRQTQMANVACLKTCLVVYPLPALTIREIVRQLKHLVARYPFARRPYFAWVDLTRVQGRHV